VEGTFNFELSTFDSSVESTLEQRVGDLTVRIDRLLCVGFGDCIEMAPDAFEFDAEGIVRFKASIDNVPRERIILACAVCPVDALSVFDAEGRQLV
jgi:ferredoxin